MKRLLATIVFATLGACGGTGGDAAPVPGGPTTPSVPASRGPARVAASNLRVVPLMSSETITIRFRNNGGDGAYRLEFWALRSSPDGANRLLTTTAPVSVTYPYDQDVSFSIGVAGATYPLTSWVVVLNRGTNETDWTRTQCIATGHLGIACPLPY